jgi:hypothetical protein
MKKTSYSDPTRLADVMALIQVLACAAKDTIRTEEGLTGVLRGKPKTEGLETWICLAENHPEFFRVNNDNPNKPAASLISRFVTAKDADGKHSPLSMDETAGLLSLAINLYDRETARRQRFNYLVPIIAAVTAALVSGLFSLAAIIIGLHYGSLSH